MGSHLAWHLSSQIVEMPLLFHKAPPGALFFVLPAGIIAAMKIPPSALDPATLQSLIEEFVSRDGTDYGVTEVSLTTRVDQVQRQLAAGLVVIWYDPESETCTLLPREHCTAD